MTAPADPAPVEPAPAPVEPEPAPAPAVPEQPEGISGEGSAAGHGNVLILGGGDFDHDMGGNGEEELVGY